MRKWFIRIYTGLRKRVDKKNRRKWQLIHKYHITRGRMPDFDNPSDFSEYIMAGILYERNDEFGVYADKVIVKDYVESKGLKEIVPQCLGVWDSASQIDYDVLPEKFALKINHGRGYNLFCRDKAAFDKKQAQLKLDDWLNRTYSTLETHYELIEPKIFAEEFIDDNSGRLPVDYRIYCFNGKPDIIDCTVYEIDDRPETFRHYKFDSDWNYLQHYDTIVYDDYEECLPRPKNLEKMLQYAAILSEDFEFVRVDLYDTGDKVYFGELTFTPSAGIFQSFSDLAMREMYQKLKE